MTFFGCPLEDGAVEELVAADVDRVLLMLPSVAPGELGPFADDAVALAERFR